MKRACRRFMSSEGLCQGNCKNFIFQPVFIKKKKGKNVISVTEFLNLTIIINLHEIRSKSS